MLIYPQRSPPALVRAGIRCFRHTLRALGGAKVATGKPAPDAEHSDFLRRGSNAGGDAIDTMKPLLLVFALSGLCLPPVQAQTTATEAPSAGAAAAAAARDPAVAFKDGQLFLIRDNQALRLEQSSLPEGQMLNADGILVPLPANITGFDASGEAAAAATSATAATVDPNTTGITMRGGKLFLVRNGQANPIDTEPLGDTMMMSLDGRHVPIPENIDFKSAGTIKPGSVAPGKVQGSSVKGPDVKGADVRGADVKGADVRGPDVRGPDVRGPDVKGSK